MRDVPVLDNKNAAGTSAPTLRLFIRWRPASLLGPCRLLELTQ